MKQSHSLSYYKIRERIKTENPGVKIVLTASSTEMSDFFKNPFMAFSAGFGLGPIPLGFARKTLYPPVERYPNERVRFAPYGLRKVETILLQNGFNKSAVAVVGPENLESFIGSNTKVVGISSMDPTGMGYVSKTYSSIIGGGEANEAPVKMQKLVSNPALQ